MLVGGPAYPPILSQLGLVRGVVFGTRSGTEGPDQDLLKVLYHFAEPVRWIHVSRGILQRQQNQSYTYLKSVTCKANSILKWLAVTLIVAFFAVWRLMPGNVRMRGYKALAYVGKRIYPASESFKIQRLPFGLFLKGTDLRWQQGLINEYHALKMIPRYCTTAVPRALDLVSDSDDIYMVMTRIPACHLGLCFDTLDDAEVEALIRDLRKFVTELRAIPRAPEAEGKISNVIGEACFDHRINLGLTSDQGRGRDFVGPFANEDEFNDILTHPGVPDVRHRSGHPIVFTHGDLNMRNVMMENGKLSGVIDWENSGFYPEYWDYTKAHFITKINKRWLGIVDRVFSPSGEFETELETEFKYWRYCQ